MRSTKAELVEDHRSLWLPGLDPTRVTSQGRIRVNSTAVRKAVGTQPSGKGSFTFGVEFEKHSTYHEWPTFGSQLGPRDQTLSQRLERNLQAIACMKALREQSRTPTLQERQLMLGYGGWSGAARMFEPIAASSLACYKTALAALVGPEDLVSARASVSRSIFPSQLVVHSIWKLIRQLGFHSGRIVEPSAGVGHMIAGMPRDMARHCEIAVFEQDRIAAGLLNLVFGDLGVSVQQSPIGSAIVCKGYYDLAVSAVAWNGPTPTEPANVAYSNWSAANYMFGKSIDLVRPGGLVVLLAPSMCMDAQKQKHRDWISAHAELVTAARLPGALALYAGGEVNAMDLLVFKKRSKPVYPSRAHWLALAQAPRVLMQEGQTLEHYAGTGRSRKWVERPCLINQWFADNPHTLLGRLVFDNSAMASPTPKILAQGGEDHLQDRLDGLIESLDGEQYVHSGTHTSGQASRMLMAVDATRVLVPGSFVVHRGRICVGKDETHWLDVDEAYRGMARRRLLGLIELRDAVSRHAERAPKPHDQDLNARYQAFVAEFGTVSAFPNARVFSSDPSWAAICQLDADLGGTHP